ncbi:MAG: hypothetical protein IJE49_12805 [Agathobacter sp.]|nr:hypothetical protein [Agathobacter sp.]
MKYFVKDNERIGTCYHEFYKGKWDKHTVWKSDSIFIHDDCLFENPDFQDAIEEVIPPYDPFGITEITFEEWRKIGEVISIKNLVSQEIYNEADVWLKDVFEVYGCFTILGI